MHTKPYTCHPTWLCSPGVRLPTERGSSSSLAAAHTRVVVFLLVVCWRIMQLLRGQCQVYATLPVPLISEDTNTNKTTENPTKQCTFVCYLRSVALCFVSDPCPKNSNAPLVSIRASSCLSAFRCALFCLGPLSRVLVSCQAYPVPVLYTLNVKNKRAVLSLCRDCAGRFGGAENLHVVYPLHSVRNPILTLHRSGQNFM